MLCRASYQASACGSIDASLAACASQCSPRWRCTLRAIQNSGNQPAWPISHSGGSTSAGRSSLALNAASKAVIQRSSWLRASINASDKRSAPARRMRCASWSGMSPAIGERELRALDARVGRVVVDRLEVLDVDRVAAHARILVQAQRDVAHQILDELRVLVGTLGDPLLVRALEQRPDLAGRAVFGEAHQFMPFDRLHLIHSHGDQRELV